MPRRTCDKAEKNFFLYSRQEIEEIQMCVNHKFKMEIKKCHRQMEQ